MARSAAATALLSIACSSLQASCAANTDGKLEESDVVSVGQGASVACLRPFFLLRYRNLLLLVPFSTTRHVCMYVNWLHVLAGKVPVATAAERNLASKPASPVSTKAVLSHRLVWERPRIRLTNHPASTYFDLCAKYMQAFTGKNHPSTCCSCLCRLKHCRSWAPE